MAKTKFTLLIIIFILLYSLLKLTIKLFDNINYNFSDATNTFDLAEKYSNIAIKYFTEWKNYQKSPNEWLFSGVDTCNTVIEPIDRLHFNNKYWQTLRFGNNSFIYLYSAFYDNREDRKQIRIIGTTDDWPYLKTTELRCLFYFDNKRSAIVVKARSVDPFLNVREERLTNGYYMSLMISCDIPIDQIPRAVSLTPRNQCPTATKNILRVINLLEGDDLGRNDNPIDRIAVCVRGLYFYYRDISLWLVEWLEMQRILGASKVFFYALAINSNVEKILNYYQNEGFVDWRETSRPGLQLNHKYLMEFYTKRIEDRLWSQERLELNDCFYRNIHKYEYILIVDIDEVVVPLVGDNWQNMINKIKREDHLSKPNFDSLVMHGAKIFEQDKSEDSEKLPVMLNNLYRGNITRANPKCFHSTKSVEIVDNHLPRKCLGNRICINKQVNESHGYFLHYRHDSIEGQQKIFDPIILNYKNVLKNRVINQLNKIYS